MPTSKVDVRDPKALARRIKWLTGRIHKLKAWRTSRRKQLQRALEKNDPAARAAKWALTLVGRHEDTGRPNRAKWLDAWARQIGEWMIGQPWCGLTVWKIARHVGTQLTPETVSTVAIRTHAQAGTGGFKAWHPATALPQIGWVPVYGTGGPQHTGFCVTPGPDAKFVEGNTSPGNGGSQNNGGGIYLRTLAERRGWLLGYAEIDWKKG